MRLTELILIFLLSNFTFGQEKYVGVYKSHFSESIELKTDSTFIHKWRFDLSSSWTTGKWRVEKDTIFLKTELVMDTLQIRDLENKVVRDSLVLSSDQKSESIEQNVFVGSLISGGGQNRHKPPKKIYWKRNRLYRINENATLDLRKIKAFSTDKKYRTYFRKETE